jgi:hypothetical protein
MVVQGQKFIFNISTGGLFTWFMRLDARTGELIKAGESVLSVVERLSKKQGVELHPAEATRPPCPL